MIPTSRTRFQLASSVALHATTTLLMLALMLSGCVKSPRDILTSWHGEEAEVEEDSDDSEAIADADDADDTTTTVSRSKADPGLPQREFGTENLLDKLLSRQKTDDRVTSDPFIATDAVAEAGRDKAKTDVSKTEAEVRRRAATLDDLLAQTKPSSTSGPDAAAGTRASVARTDRAKTETKGSDRENRFASNFESRLDQLKADLQRETKAAADEVNSFAEFMASQEKNGASVTSVSYKNESEPLPERGFRPNQKHPLEDVNISVKSRVQGLLNQAHDDWESWKLEEAYRKALAAQELAVLQGVEFDVSEERPADLAKRIADDIRKDSISTTMAKAESWTDETDSGDDPFSQIASRTFESFAAGAPNIGWQSAASPTTGSSKEMSNGQYPRIEPSEVESRPSTNGGVNLMSPSSDDFPSEAEGNRWSMSSSADFASNDHDNSSSREIVNLAWPEDADSSGDRSSASPGFSQGPSLARYETDSYTPPGEVALESNTDLLSHVAANRDRVLGSGGPQWPALPAPDATSVDRRKPEPVQVAVAPPVLLGVNDTPAASVTAPEIAPTVQAANTRTPAASLWYSRPLWFVGGLILLMLSMRLLSRRSFPSV